MLYDDLTQEELDWNGTWSGFPTSPELRQWQEESSEKRVALIKKRLVDVGYTDAAGNVLKPKMETPSTAVAGGHEWQYVRRTSDPTKQV